MHQCQGHDRHHERTGRQQQACDPDPDLVRRQENSAESIRERRMEMLRLRLPEQLEVHRFLLLNHAHHLPGATDIEGDVIPPAEAEVHLRDHGEGDAYHPYLAEMAHGIASIKGETGLGLDLGHDLYHHLYHAEIINVLTLSGRINDATRA